MAEHARRIVVGYDDSARAAAAAGLEADLVVVGRRSGNPLRRFVLGSVSAKVVRDAQCDALVVR